MAVIESALLDLGGLDALALGRSPVHALDPRAKVIVTAVFIIAVVSFGKYDLAAMLPFLLYPVLMISLGNLPVRPLLFWVLLATPFVLCVGIFNPLLDRAPVASFGALTITGGWLSFASIMLRFFLTLSAALILVATTGMTAVCVGLVRLGVPRAFAVQLLLLYRYLFVLMDEGARMLRAHALRSAGGGRVPLRVFGSLAGQLLVRALDRAQRLHVAMLCRGFDGEFRLVRPLRFQKNDYLFIMTWLPFCLLWRQFNLPHLLGQLLLRIFS